MVSGSFVLISAPFFQLHFAVQMSLRHRTADTFFPFLEGGGISQHAQVTLFSFAKGATR